jgi:hypothetical protein
MISHLDLQRPFQHSLGHLVKQPLRAVQPHSRRLSVGNQRIDRRRRQQLRQPPRRRVLLLVYRDLVDQLGRLRHHVLAH